jgi:hypothetical protein
MSLISAASVIGLQQAKRTKLAIKVCPSESYTPVAHHSLSQDMPQTKVSTVRGRIHVVSLAQCCFSQAATKQVPKVNISHVMSSPY